MADYGVTYLTAEHQWNNEELLSCIDGKLKKNFSIKKFLFFKRNYDT